MIVYEHIEQRSDEWLRLRAGRPTASQFSRIITPGGKTNPSSWAKYALELTAESIRPDEAGWTGNRHTERGNELEADAREAFEARMGLEAVEVGFVTRADGVIGCSPDALIRPPYSGGDGAPAWVAGLEIKCPSPKVHAATLIEGEMPAEHLPQVHGSMAVTGLGWWYFVSYCPGFRMVIKRVQRNDYTAKVEKALDDFLAFYRERRAELLPQLVEAK